MLTDTALRNLKPKSKIYKASDRDGMYVSREVVKEALRLNAAAVAFSHMRTRWVRDRQHGLRLPLEHTVKKQAMETTGIYGMRDRGQLKPGYLADVNIIDFDRLRLPPPYVAFDLPAGGA